MINNNYYYYNWHNVLQRIGDTKKDLINTGNSATNYYDKFI